MNGRFGDTFAVSVEVFDEETFMAIWGGDFDSRGLDIVEVDDDIIGLRKAMGVFRNCHSFLHFI